VSDSIRIENPLNVDKRALRTRHLLAEALMSLGAEQDVDTLDVGDLVAEAGVSRSTFYAHFASKDDFLVRSFVNMIAATEAAVRAKFPDRADLLPSHSLFAHIYNAGDFARGIARSEIFPAQLAAGEQKLRDIVEENLRRRAPHWGAEQRREAAVFIAAGFIGLIKWWMQGGLKQTPDRMEAAFQRLATNAMREA